MLRTGFLKALLLPILVLVHAFFGVNALAKESDFPNKAMTLIVPFPPGGPTDVSGRIIAEALGKELGQTVIVENKTGASGTIGINQLIRSKPDGYTLAALAAPSLTGQFILAQKPYDLTTDIKTIGKMYETPLVIVVNPKYTPEIKDLGALIKMAKEAEHPLNYTTAGIGSTAHLAIELIQKETDVTLEHIPFRGSAPAISALLAGDVVFMYSDLVAALAHIKSGDLYPIAVNTKERISELADTQTIQEQGYQSAKTTSWGGLIAPKDTSEHVVNVLSAALEKSLENPDVQERLRAVGSYPTYTDSQALQQIINNDSEIWSSVIEQNNLKQGK